MNLKEKAIEAKAYGETKTILMKLINDFLLEYKNYDELYKKLFIIWRDNTINEFKRIFKEENFDIKEERKSYSTPMSKYKRVCANFYDLEFELSIDEDKFDDIRFLQNKPSDDTKNILLRPTIAQYSISEIIINSVIPYKTIRIRSVSDLKNILKNVENAEYAVNDMQELYNKLTIEMTNLLEESNKLNTNQINSVAVDSNFSGMNKDKKYGNFVQFTEFVEML